MKEWHLPTACPECRAAAVTPYRAMEVGNQIDIALRCTSCRHEWMVCAPEPAFVLIRKPDRRSSTPRNTRATVEAKSRSL
jgi:hypothetical protein